MAGFEVTTHGRFCTDPRGTHTSLDKRLSQIRNASPYQIDVLAARPGTLEDEATLHEGAKEWRHDLGGRSWYTDCIELRRYVDKFFYPDTMYDQQASEELPASGSPAEEVLSVCEQLSGESLSVSECPPCEFD
jgi:hypothetical protein